MQQIENVVLVGEPTNQGPNYFAGTQQRHKLHHSGVSFMVSDWAFTSTWPEYETNAIRPEIFIPWTLEDVLALRDPVLEFVKSR